MVVPIGNVLPDGSPAVCTRFSPAQLSSAVTLNVTTAPHAPASLDTEISDGQTTLGFSLSTTVTLNEHVLVFPAASVTTKVLVVVPMGNVLPDGSPAVCTRFSPAQLSSAR